MTLLELVHSARARFRAAGIDANEAAIDAEYLARRVLEWDRARFLVSENSPAPPGFAEAFEAVVERRETREPVAYIVGMREFWGLDFEVSPAVLIPRPESEFIVEEALACLGDHEGIRNRESGFGAAADVGTGSGCLAVTLAVARPSLRIVATDISPDALTVAARNVERHAVAGRVVLVETDVLEGVDGPFSLIVSNPPYVPAVDEQALPPEVQRFEPLHAILGGADGLDVVRRLLEQAQHCLEPGGWLIFEFGFGQEEAVRRAISGFDGLSLVRIRADLQGIPRTAVVERRPPR